MANLMMLPDGRALHVPTQLVNDAGYIPGPVERTIVQNNGGKKPWWFSQKIPANQTGVPAIMHSQLPSIWTLNHVPHTA